MPRSVSIAASNFVVWDGFSLGAVARTAFAGTLPVATVGALEPREGSKSPILAVPVGSVAPLAAVGADMSVPRYAERSLTFTLTRREPTRVAESSPRSIQLRTVCLVHLQSRRDLGHGEKLLVHTLSLTENWTTSACSKSRRSS
jgi:hypothetical protein